MRKFNFYYKRNDLPNRVRNIGDQITRLPIFSLDILLEGQEFD